MHFIPFIKNNVSEIIFGIENENDNLFEWIGTKKITIKDFNKNEINCHFYCIIKNEFNEDFEKKFQEELNKIYILIIISKQHNFKNNNFYSSHLIKK